jgi:hypothetical protein
VAELDRLATCKTDWQSVQSRDRPAWPPTVPRLAQATFHDIRTSETPLGDLDFARRPTTSRRFDHTREQQRARLRIADEN